MPDERTRRFDRLLAMREQLERLEQWRLAAARRDRFDAEARLRAMELTLENDQAALGGALAAGCEARAIQSALTLERLGRGRLVLQQATIDQLMKTEEAIRARHFAAQQRTQQSEKLCDQAHEEFESLEQLALQREWDEHGLRSCTQTGGFQIRPAAAASCVEEVE